MLRLPAGEGVLKEKVLGPEERVHCSHPDRASFGLGEQVMAWEMTGVILGS